MSLSAEGDRRQILPTETDWRTFLEASLKKILICNQPAGRWLRSGWHTPVTSGSRTAEPVPRPRRRGLQLVLRRGKSFRNNGRIPFSISERRAKSKLNESTFYITTRTCTPPCLSTLDFYCW